MLLRVITKVYGPGGKHVILRLKNEKYRVLDKGSEIIRYTEQKDPFENLGIQLMKPSARKMQKEAGEGTSTLIILAASLLDAGLRMTEQKISHQKLLEGLNKSLYACQQYLPTQITEIRDNPALKHKVALTLTHNRQQEASLLIKAFEEAGTQGFISAEKGEGTQTRLEFKDGMHFNRGYLSPYFITHKHAMQVELDNPYILLYDDTISDIQDILPLLETCHKQKRSLAIIAKNVEEIALSTLIINSIRKIIRIGAVKLPSIGEARDEIIEDMAVYCGGIVFTRKKGVLLSFAEPRMLGQADKMIISEKESFIIGGKGSKEKIQERIQQVRQALTRQPTLYQKQKLLERLGMLSGKSAFIKTGAPTETELIQKQHELANAIITFRISLEEGVLPGGGVALLSCIPLLEKLEQETMDPDVVHGISIMKTALQQPSRYLLQNAGLDPAPIIDKIKQASCRQIFNLFSRQLESMDAAGVYDPSKVILTAIKLAVSTASTMFQTEALLTRD